MMIASDYKIRRRDVAESLSGRPDVAVLLEIGVYGLVASFLILELAGPPRWRRTSPLLFATWGFGFTLAFSALYSIYPTMGVVRGIQLLIVCGLAQAIARHGTGKQLHRMAHSYVVLVGISILIGIVLPLARQGRHVDRFNWFYVHPVITGSYLGVAVVLLLGYVVMRRNGRVAPVWPTWAYSTALGVACLALLATRTRGAIAGTVVGCLVVLALASRPQARLDMVVLIPVVGCLAAILFGDHIVRFLERGESLDQLATLNARTGLWDQAIQLFVDRPFTGYGLTAARGVFFETSGLGGAHNGLINVLTDAGIVGLVWWLALLFLLARTLIKLTMGSRLAEGFMLLGVLAFLIVNSMTTEGLGTPANVSNIWLFVLVGWAEVLRRESESGLAPGHGIASSTGRQQSE